MAYKVTETALDGIIVLEPEIFGDARGFFMESFNQRDFEEATQSKFNFVQDNHSMSSRGVLRGLHYQLEKPQGKLVRVIRGKVFDVVVDIRKSSTTYGAWFGCELSSENRRQMWVPPGFAHGFLVLSEKAELLYKATDYYAPNSEHCLAWSDPDLGIRWPLEMEPVLSRKDEKGLPLSQLEVFE